MTPTPHTYLGLCARARRLNQRVRLGIDTDARPSRINRLALADRDGEEIEYVDFPTKTVTTLDDAAAVLLEFVERTTNQEEA